MWVIGVFTTVQDIKPIVEDFTVGHGFLILSTGLFGFNSEGTKTEKLIGADVGQTRDHGCGCGLCLRSYAALSCNALGMTRWAEDTQPTSDLYWIITDPSSRNVVM